MPTTPAVNRRTALMYGAATAGVAAAGGLSLLGDDLLSSLAEPRRPGDISDVEHVVVFMQENRSFDHYYGSLSGVRGFGDTATVDGVFAQPDVVGTRTPFRVNTAQFNGQRLDSLDHSWDGVHKAWAGGSYNDWISGNGALTMGYLTRADIPFHYALADAFTICDHNFCSVLGPTIPNRLYLFSGTIDPSGRSGGPVVSNPPAYEARYRWTTYPERLQAAGVSWKVYANNEVGNGRGEDAYVGDFGTNPLWLFHAYHESLKSKDPNGRVLAQRGSVHGNWLPNSGKGHDVEHLLADFIADCAAGTLPRVSYIIAPNAYCEHPASRPVDGALYVATVLRALFDNPALWNSTAVFLNYDEHDGYFDHVPPPVPSSDADGEHVAGRPIGLGPRVPMTVISPWSRGGWVCSEVFDHTSVIQFLERWTGVAEPNISAWRRAVCGDLTGAFDFRDRVTTIPMLPDMVAAQRAVDGLEADLPDPMAPGTADQEMPGQEPGPRPIRPLPYQLIANVSTGQRPPTILMENHGVRPAQIAVYSDDHPPKSYLSYPNEPSTLPIPVSSGRGYRVALHGPAGFVRVFADAATPTPLEVALALVRTGSGPTLEWTARNTSGSPVQMRVTDTLTAQTTALEVPAGATRRGSPNSLGTTDGWYDLTFQALGAPTFERRYAGHLEDGEPSTTRPL